MWVPEGPTSSLACYLTHIHVDSRCSFTHSGASVRLRTGPERDSSLPQTVSLWVCLCFSQVLPVGRCVPWVLVCPLSFLFNRSLPLSFSSTVPFERKCHEQESQTVRAGLFKLKSWLPGVENERNKTNAGKTASKKASEGRRREARN